MQWEGRLPVTYRRREVNTGFKAGNFRDFLERWGDGHDFMVTLDADSFMTAAGDPAAGRHHADRSEARHPAEPRVGMPSTSAFARIFQFGMRLGMRSWTDRQRLVAGRLRTYWGHNAVIRVAPFIAALRRSRRCPAAASWAATC